MGRNPNFSKSLPRLSLYSAINGMSQNKALWSHHTGQTPSLVMKTQEGVSL